MCQAKHANTPSPREDFDKSLSEANIIAAIVNTLAEGEIAGAAAPGASLYEWLSGELIVRLDAIETADSAMRGLA